MQVKSTDLPGVMLIKTNRIGDARGYFSESWNRRQMADRGFDVDFVQDNESLSLNKGTLRGLHCQAPPFAQAKLVRVVRGAVLDVAVDVRQGSPSYLDHVAVELSADNGHQLFIPQGFLHGFLTLTPDAHVLYKVDNHYSAECDQSVRWNDPAIGIDWGVDAQDLWLSDKDAAAPTLEQWQSPFQWAVA